MMVKMPVMCQWSRRFSSSLMLDQAVEADLTQRRGSHVLNETFKWLSVLAWAVPPKIYDIFGGLCAAFCLAACTRAAGIHLAINPGGACQS